MAEKPMNLDVMRSQTMLYAIHIDKVTDEQLVRLTRYVFTDEFAHEVIRQQTTLETEEEKIQAYKNLYKKHLFNPEDSRGKGFEERRDSI